MSVEGAKIVDAVGIDSASGEVVLTIADHLQWDDTRAHFEALQSKLNDYLAFVEGGELLQQYPGAEGRPVRIDVVLKYQPSDVAVEFFNEAGAMVQAAGFALGYRVLDA